MNEIVVRPFKDKIVHKNIHIQLWPIIEYKFNETNIFKTCLNTDNRYYAIAVLSNKFVAYQISTKDNFRDIYVTLLLQVKPVS